jgi:hypothetical protein
MNGEADFLLTLADQYIDHGRPVPALLAFERASEAATVPAVRLLATYNAGVVHWDKLGDGIAAREAFIQAVGLQGPEYDSEQLRILRAGALENLMLSALSFEEFDEFARRLAELTPQMPILHGLRPVADELRESGSPWSDMLIARAMSNYNRNDPRLDRGRYGVAKSTYHLLLTHRKRLRVSREDWRLIIYEYIALSQRMAVDYMKARGGDFDSNPPEEFLSVLTEALPLVDEYLLHCPADRLIAKLRKDMDFVIGNSRARGLATRQSADQERYPQPNPPGGMRCMRCGYALSDPTEPCGRCEFVNMPAIRAVFPGFLGSLLGGWLTWWYLDSAAPMLRIAAALVVAFLTLSILGPLFARWLSRDE